MSNVTVYELVSQQEQYFIGALGENKVEWVKESQFAIQILGNNKSLGDMALSAQASLQNAVINVAAIGISLNPALKHAYLVPRGGIICLDISYMGLMHIAMQSGSIEWGQAKLVYANDEYQNTGIDKAPSHKQNTFGDKGFVVGAYCTVKTSSGDYLTEEMDINALNKVKATSKAIKGPWKQWPEEMMRKTVVKRASKYWPKVERLSTAIETLNAHEGLEESPEKETNGAYMVVDQTEINNLKGAIKFADMEVNAFCKRVQIDSIETLPAARYQGAMNWLKKQAIPTEVA
tara:strand:+ start:505 stop:1374 length:870 start_codon:yes stop_codon:yes gene_type:complete